MLGSQEASLDENALFLSVNPASPEFLYSEVERQSVEKLLNEGPKAFYYSVGAELFGSFLSPNEVEEITGWVQDFHFNPLPKEENEQKSNPDTVELISSYFPSYSDAPAPGLELGWPEAPWVRMENVAVYTNPPAEGEPPIREVIRRHLQKASQVIAIVTDRLTDATIIGDLHNAASRGVPVYIILNKRTIEEKYTLHRLGHPNIRVRLLEGKSFCSRKGKMVVGELKDKFLLVDLETVLHGSYSLTWTDAHLHRQLVTVVNGSAVDTFDKEFRTLFAASAPVPNLWEFAIPRLEVPQQRMDFSDPSPPRHFHMKYEILNPPSPPMDVPLDWEAMGVFPRDRLPDSPLEMKEGLVAKEAVLQTDMQFDKKTPVTDTFTYNGYKPMTTRRTWESSPGTNNMPENSKTSNWTDRQIEQPASRQFSKEKLNNVEDRTSARFEDKDGDWRRNLLFSSLNYKRRSRYEPSVREEKNTDDDISASIENKASSRKPLILRVPQSESFNSMNDLMKRFRPQHNNAELLRRGSKTAMSEMTHSMMDLHMDVPSADRAQDDRRLSVPRLNTSSFEPDQMTPGLMLMKRRNDVVKSALQRIPQAFQPRERPRSYALDLNWKSLRERKGEEGE
ncbi:protein FAM83E [Dunckerocampus dactyliophorus]|uniref:protein FAM83E n=1 Tax=Dunckerocampus dactyliophorus TaxID=161453 RepID=UPI002406237D|nr:protein FAM83E [Dunckerocampus dactyliophorus]